MNPENFVDCMVALATLQTPQAYCHGAFILTIHRRCCTHVFTWHAPHWRIPMPPGSVESCLIMFNHHSQKFDRPKMLWMPWFEAWAAERNSERSEFRIQTRYFRIFRASHVAAGSSHGMLRGLFESAYAIWIYMDLYGLYALIAGDIFEP